MGYLAELQSRHKMTSLIGRNRIKHNRRKSVRLAAVIQPSGNCSGVVCFLSRRCRIGNHSSRSLRILRRAVDADDCARYCATIVVDLIVLINTFLRAVDFVRVGISDAFSRVIWFIAPHTKSVRLAFTGHTLRAMMGSVVTNLRVSVFVKLPP